MEIKICTQCGQEKPKTNEYFLKLERGIDGLRGACRECVKARRRRHYQQNKEKVVAWNRGWRKRNSEILKEYHDKYYKENREAICQQKQEYYYLNKDRLTKYHKQYLQTERGRQVHQRLRELRRARKRTVPATYTIEQWAQCKSHFNNTCAYCGKPYEQLQQDHFIAVKNGGEYTVSNIVPACLKCNYSKQDKDFFVWYPKKKYYAKKREQKILKYLGYVDGGGQQLSILAIP